MTDAGPGTRIDGFVIDGGAGGGLLIIGAGAYVYDASATFVDRTFYNDDTSLSSECVGIYADTNSGNSAQLAVTDYTFRLNSAR